MVDQVRLEGMKRYGFGPDVMKGTKVCRVCGQSCSSVEKYCSKCDAILPKETVFDLYKTYHLYCPECDTVVSSSSQFCPECGKSLRQQQDLNAGTYNRLRTKYFRCLGRFCRKFR